MFENESDTKVDTEYYLPKVEIKYCNAMIDGKTHFDQPFKIDVKTYGNIQKTATGQEDDCTTCFLINHNYFKEHFKLIATYLIKQQALDAEQKQCNKSILLTH